MGDTELLTAITNLTQDIIPFWDLAMIFAYIIGAITVVVGFCVLGKGGRPAFGIASCIFGTLLLGLPTILDAASQTIFQSDAPKGLSVVSSGGGADTVFITFSTTVAVLTGLIAVIKSLTMFSKIGSGSSGASMAHAVTYFVAGILCINITTVTLALGSSVGGTFQQVVNRLFTGG